jgi:hypothetical protein
MKKRNRISTHDVGKFEWNSWKYCENLVVDVDESLEEKNFATQTKLNAIHSDLYLDLSQLIWFCLLDLIVYIIFWNYLYCTRRIYHIGMPSRT